jgi:hypothetical protein
VDKPLIIIDNYNTDTKAEYQLHCGPFHTIHMKIFTENKFSRFILKDGEEINGLIIFCSFDQAGKKHYLVREQNLSGFRLAMLTNRDAARRLCERFEIDRIRRSSILEGMHLN